MIEQNIEAAREFHKRPVNLTRTPSIALYNHWQKSMDGKGKFLRSECDMLTLPLSVVPHLMILDTEWTDRGQVRAKYRLTGTHVDLFYDETLRDSYVDQLQTREWACFWNSSYALPVVEQCPAFGLVSIGWRDRQHIYAEFIFLPMWNDQDTPTMLACAVDFFMSDDGPVDNALMTPPF